MASLNISIKLPSADAGEYAAADQRNRCLGKAASLLRGIAGGQLAGTVSVSRSSSDSAYASGTVTLATVAVDDTVTIGKTTLTAKASPSTEDQFSQAGTNAQDAASLAAKINAHSVLSKLVSATSAGAVVTIKPHQRGSIGNYIALASSDGVTLAVSGAYLAGGTGGAESAPVTYR